jgi:hypothetical protein
MGSINRGFNKNIGKEKIDWNSLKNIMLDSIEREKKNKISRKKTNK